MRIRGLPGASILVLVLAVGPPAQFNGARAREVLHFFNAATSGDNSSWRGVDGYNGTTSRSGKRRDRPVFIAGRGTVFELAPNGTETILHAFTGWLHGAYPAARLIMGAGNLYGTTEEGGNRRYSYGTVFELTPNGTESVLYAFKGGSDGANPHHGLIKDRTGNLYGTTTRGGGAGCDNNDCGTVFKLAPNGTETVLHAFGGGSDGADPESGVIRDGTGNLYGTTFVGGGNGACGGIGCGTVFKLTPDGSETILHAFTRGSDGAAPDSGLIPDSAGNLYGTTLEGGSASCGGVGCGTVFRLASGGSVTILHGFGGGSDGAYPRSPLIQDRVENLYGTTSEGGNSRCDGQGCGTIFKLAPDGTETVLYAFRGGSDGAHPYAGLTQDDAGNLYGTTSEGGSSHCSGHGCGTVFRLAPGGSETVLYVFEGVTDGAYPYAGLIQDKAGNLIGTTSKGGAQY